MMWWWLACIPAWLLLGAYIRFERCVFVALAVRAEAPFVVTSVSSQCVVVWRGVMRGGGGVCLGPSYLVKSGA